MNARAKVAPTMLALAAMLLLVAGGLLYVASRTVEGQTVRMAEPQAPEATPRSHAVVTPAAMCQGPARRVCIVPFGSVPNSLLEHLVQYYKDEYNLTLHVLPRVPLGNLARQDQLSAVDLRDLMASTYPQLDSDTRVILIGLVTGDIYLPSAPNWLWAFGERYRSTSSGNVYHQAILSTSRMDPASYGYYRDDELRNERLRKMLNKYIAVMYYGVRQSDDPRSVTYNAIGGLDDLDYMTEEIPGHRVR